MACGGFETRVGDSVLVGVCDGEIGRRTTVESSAGGGRWACGGSAGPDKLLVEKKMMVVGIGGGGMREGKREELEGRSALYTRLSVPAS